MAINQILTTADQTTGLPVLFILLGAAAVGVVIGSFLNVVIHRVPRGESIISPGSHCGACGAPVRAYDNIPIISYLLLGGRCRHCRAVFSARYLAVEALTGLLFALAAWRVVQYFNDAQAYEVMIGINRSAGLVSFALTLIFDFAFFAAIIALVFIDAEHMLLPNAITYPGLALAIAARLAVPNLNGVGFLATGPLSGWPVWGVSMIGALVGALIGGGSLWLVGWLWERLRGVEAMGLGDVKMMLMVGAYLGWPLTVLTIFIGVLTGSIAGVALMLRRGERDMQMLLPFGIFLGLGAVASLLVGPPLINWYVSQFQ